MDLGNLKNLDVKDLVEKLKGMDLMSNKKLLIKFGIGFVSILIFQLNLLHLNFLNFLNPY